MHRHADDALPPDHVPSVRGLDAALGGVQGSLATVDRFRTTHGTNLEGGDPGHHASPDLLVRHTVNYLLAADVADPIAIDGPLLDVGSGVGAFSMWLARRLDRELHLVDHDPEVLRLARRSFAGVEVHPDASGAPQGAVVTAMEVLEHLRYRDQYRFAAELYDRVAPGGVLLCSTPDERRYLGGWSGYAPHIGVLDASSLRTLLERATGRPAQVWRIAGPGFDLGRVQRVAEPVANRAWTLAQSWAPRLTDRLAGAVGSRRRGRAVGLHPTPPSGAFTVTPADDPANPGTGLIGAVHRPA
jgi:SAM-dependent methyltransferase